MPAPDRFGTGMRRQVHGGHSVVEGFVSFIPLVGSACVPSCCTIVCTMLPRTAAVGLLLVACAHPASEKPQVQPSPAAEATPSTPPSSAAPTATGATKGVQFARDVRPILESRCQPCHFAGGKVYDRLPFDRPETIRQLGLKLFTRIKDEDSQATIRAFLSHGE